NAGRAAGPSSAAQLNASAATADHAVVDRLGKRVLQSRGKAVVQPPAQLQLAGVALRIAARNEINKTAGNHAPAGKSVGIEFLRVMRAFVALVHRDQNERTRQIALHRNIPILRIPDTEIRVNAEVVRRNDRGTDKAVGER